MDWEKEINKIFDNAYSKDLSACPKHTIFRRQKALNEILSLIRQHIPEEALIRKDERERIHQELEFAIKVKALNVNNGVLLWDIINNQAEQALGEKMKPPEDNAKAVREALNAFHLKLDPSDAPYITNRGIYIDQLVEIYTTQICQIFLGGDKEEGNNANRHIS